ncbi:MAG: T9SS type A sorting domain-containing protein [Cytophagales bacterium]|nr:T9SS type A sorting domain-containing protein [Cytophagales bacterium]
MTFNKLKKLITLALVGCSFSISWAAQVETVTNLNASGEGSFDQALKNVDENGTINFAEELSGNISVSALQLTISGVTINGNPDVIIDGGGTYKTAIWLDNLFTIVASDVAIYDLAFENGTGPNAWSGIGVLIADGYDNITLENCSVSNNKNAGIANSDWVPAGQTSQGINNLTLINCIATGNGSSGLQLVRTNNLIIEGGEYYANQQGGIYFDRSVTNAYINNVEVYDNGLGETGNTNGNAGSGIRIYNGGGQLLQKSHTITIANSKIYNNNAHGIELPFDADDIQIHNNEIYENGVSPSATGFQASGITFQFGGSDNCIVTNNKIHGNKDDAIYMYNIPPNEKHSSNIFYNNEIYNGNGGITLIGAEESYIINNSFSNIGQSDVIFANNSGSIRLGTGTSHSIIQSNFIDNPKISGILVDNSLQITGSDEIVDSVSILDNQIDGQNTKDALYGIRIQDAQNTFIGEFENQLPMMTEEVINPITQEVLYSFTLDFTPEKNTIVNYTNTGVLIDNSSNTLISKDSISCGVGYGTNKIKHINIIHTTIESKDVFVEKNINENTVSLGNLETVTELPVEAYLFADESTCIDKAYNYLQTASLNSENNLVLDVPNVASVDSLLLFITNQEGNTFARIINLNKVVTNNSDFVDTEIHTYTQNGLFVIENSQLLQVTVSNTNGQVIEKYQNTNSLEIGNHLSQGLYIISMQTNDGKVISKKYFKF